MGLDKYVKMGIIGEGSFGKVIHRQDASRIPWAVYRVMLMRLAESLPCAEASAVTSRYVFLADIYIRPPKDSDKAAVRMICRSTKAAEEEQGRPWP